jgi:hypothetical protein
MRNFPIGANTRQTGDSAQRVWFLSDRENARLERQLPKLDVAGSIPVSRSIFLSHLQRIGTCGSGLALIFTYLYPK